VQISAVGKEHGAKATSDLEFVMLTDRARAEQTRQAIQSPSMDALVADIIRRHDFNADEHATLYELLLPNTIKDQVKETANLMLVLDPAAANYPWEMLCERGQEPLSVRFGLLRQLKTRGFRPDVRTSSERRALVIGDPDTGDPLIPRLPGAQREAKSVVAELKKCGYDVVDKTDGQPALDIMSALHSGEYRIVHIAAHGFYDRRDPKRRGVMLGTDKFLTAVEFGQWRVVPELVFLNCCHLGKVDQQPAPWNKLAASVAQELIDIGVRAVVVAGWAVNDEAGREFAIRFYHHLLAEKGQFGEAVRHARRSTYEKYNQSNTWGAYQCYGLPSFVLGRQLRKPSGPQTLPVTQNELIEQLQRIRVDAQTADLARRKALVDEVRGCDYALRREWRTGRALYQLGESYAELGELQPAIDCYTQALSPKEIKSEVPIRALEQLANVKVRYALRLRREAQQREADGGEKAEASSQERKALLEDARKRLELALGFGKTLERLALFGSCFKRLALESDNEEREVNIRLATKYYRQAYEQVSSQSVGSSGFYPALNWITLQFLANSPKKNKKQQRAFLTEIKKNEELASLRQAEQPSFWERVTTPDAALLRALIQGNLEGQADAVCQQYQEVFQRSTAYERESVFNQLDFLSEILAWKQHALADPVSKLRQKLAT
jgi:CHAT domain-containing protein